MPENQELNKEERPINNTLIIKQLLHTGKF